MRVLLLALLIVPFTFATGAVAGAAPAAQNSPDAALLRLSDLPAGWSDDGPFDWQQMTVPDGAGGMTSLGIATSAEPRPSPTQLGDRGVGATLSERVSDGPAARYRGIQHAVIPVDEGQGGAKFALLRAAMREGTFRISEDPGVEMVWEYTVIDAPDLGEESYALRMATWHEVSGSRVGGDAQGVLYAFRRGDAIAIFAHIEGSAVQAPLDTALTDRLSRLADQRLTALARGPVKEGGDVNVPLLAGVVAALALIIAGAALFVLRNRRRPHAPHPA